MRECAVTALVLLCSAPALGQTVPAGWKVVKDAKAACQIAVPPDWVPFGDNSGAAVFHDSTTAIAVVTSQPGQDFKALSPMLVKSIGIPRERLYENSGTRIFYQDRLARTPDETSAWSSSVPSKGGTCSCHVVAVPAVPEDTAKKIALSLSPVPDKT